MENEREKVREEGWEEREEQLGSDPTYSLPL
jgi:hypothetical protein